MSDGPPPRRMAQEATPCSLPPHIRAEYCPKNCIKCETSATQVSTQVSSTTKSSGRIIVSAQPLTSNLNQGHFGGDSLTKLLFGLTCAEVAIICPDYMSNKRVSLIPLLCPMPRGHFTYGSSGTKTTQLLLWLINQPPLVYAPRNKALWSGLINHWFPSMRLEIKPFWGGYVGGGRLTSHNPIRTRNCQILCGSSTRPGNFLCWEASTCFLEGERIFHEFRKKKNWSYTYKVGPTRKTNCK